MSPYFEWCVQLINTTEIQQYIITLGYFQDAQRVLNRFREASNQGVVVEQGEVALSEILTHLYQHGPVILLTNAHLLTCERCAKTMPQLRSCLPCSPPYQGHYILLIGYSMKRSLVYYKNPSFKDHTCSIGFSRLDKARQSYGTDEDALFIYDYKKLQDHLGSKDQKIL